MKHKHVPLRTCLGCHQVRPKRSMIRIVRTPEGAVVIDETGKRAGRGGYLCQQSSCWELALSRGALERGLETTLTAEDRAVLREVASRLTAQADSTTQALGNPGESGVSGLRA